MGQLEKYGLYVLCLVIFLILGVTIWGGGDVPQGRSPSAAIRAPGAGAPPPAVVNASASRSLAETLLGPVGNEAPRTGGTPGNDPPKNEPKADPKDAPKADPKPAALQVAYKVQEGDTYESIARERLGKGSLWTEVARLNPTIEPKKLRAGQEIQVPTAAALAGADATRARSVDAVVPPAPDVNRTYVVKKGDTYERIAMVELGSKKRTNDLIEMNTIPPTKLKPGDRIKLPNK